MRKATQLMQFSIIKKGKVKVTVVSKQGKEAVVALLSADDFFGEGCLIVSGASFHIRPAATIGS